MINKLPDSTPLSRVLDAVAWLCLAVSGVCMVVLVSSFGWLVYGRYVLNDTPTWVEQVALLMVVTITFLGAAVGVYQRTHLNVDLFSALLPPRGKIMLSVSIDLLMGLFGGLMAWQAYGLVMFAWNKSIPLLGVPDGLRYIPMVISGALILVFSLSRIPAALRGQHQSLAVTEETS
ncbi:TRAP transporter small permease [Neptunomonas phycophila]|uniref:TRAP transporter small permease n=1 Tax=Neptunomonas phycophila TaxID=1572645 RepID=UPI0026E286D6|nr:TRAP transporter small permease [Neptunomonas phycophila]MDO6785422.1 TRAP transporter small permease [Neptunomonas phycophila]